MGGILGMVLLLKVGVCIKKCAEISMASLGGNLACVHAKVCTHDGIQTEGRVRNLREVVGVEIGAPCGSRTRNKIF